MGAGHPDGHTDEGYLTMAIGGGNARVVVQDNGTFNFRVLSSRQGVSEFTIKDNGQVHIFDVFAGRGNVEGEEEPDRPVESGGFAVHFHRELQLKAHCCFRIMPS